MTLAPYKRHWLASALVTVAVICGFGGIVLVLIVLCLEH
jgi:hypothetical protein